MYRFMGVHFPRWFPMVVAISATEDGGMANVEAIGTDQKGGYLVDIYRRRGDSLSVGEVAFERQFQRVCIELQGDESQSEPPPVVP